MAQLIDGPVFAIDGEVFQWQDVFAHAQVTGRWAELERAAREGLACAAHADTLTAEQESLDAIVEAAGDEFRYDRDLLTADEMEQWLESRGLTARTWLEAVRRRVLRERWAGEAAGLVARYAPSADDVETALAADLVCSDVHAALAHELAEVAAAAVAAPAGEAPAGDRLEALRDAAARFRRGAVTDEALRKEIAMHQMDWVKIDCRAVEFALEAEAREAALCLREDGMPLEDVARDAHVGVGVLSFYLEEVSGDDRSRFLASHAGDVVGPIPVDDVHVLYRVDRKVMPGPEDPGVVARAVELVAARAVSVEVQRRVQWLADAARTV